MNETTVKPIGSIRSPERGSPAKVLSSDRTEHANVRERAVFGVDRSIKQIETEKDRSGHMSNISIHFNVDDETNRLIVVVSERESGRVIRTIPASEFEKMQAGDLLKLRA